MSGSVNGKDSKKNIILRCAAIVLALIFLISAVLLFVHIWEERHSEYNGDYVVETSGDSLMYNNQEYVLNDDIETVLVMGLDKFDGEQSSDSYNNDKQADFIMLLVIDNANSSYTALHINRDTMAQMDILGVAGNKVGTVTKQIALAYNYGNGKEVSCRNTAEAVSNLLLGTKVDHYISVTMDSVPVFNDLVGGVEVTVLDDFTGIDDTLIKGEQVTLFGEHSLNYVRSRYGLEDSSNENRMKRQRQYLEALFQKTSECVQNDSEFIAQAAVKMSEYMVSDCSGNRLQALFKKISEYQFGEICTIQGESVVGDKFMEFYPDEDSIYETVINLFYEIKE